MNLVVGSCIGVSTTIQAEWLRKKTSKAAELLTALDLSNIYLEGVTLVGWPWGGHF